MTPETRFRILAFVTALGTSLLTGYAASQTVANKLASPDSFADIADQDARGIIDGFDSPAIRSTSIAENGS